MSDRTPLPARLNGVRSWVARHECYLWAGVVAAVLIMQWPMLKGVYYRAAGTPVPPTSIEWRTGLCCLDSGCRREQFRTRAWRRDVYRTTARIARLSESVWMSRLLPARGLRRPSVCTAARPSRSPSDRPEEPTHGNQATSEAGRRDQQEQAEGVEPWRGRTTSSAAATCPRILRSS